MYWRILKKWCFTWANHMAWVLISSYIKYLSIWYLWMYKHILVNQWVLAPLLLLLIPLENTFLSQRQGNLFCVSSIFSGQNIYFIVASMHCSWSIFLGTNKTHAIAFSGGSLSIAEDLSYSPPPLCTTQPSGLIFCKLVPLMTQVYLFSLGCLCGHTPG